MSAAAIIESEGPIADDGRTEGKERASDRGNEKEAKDTSERALQQLLVLDLFN